MDGGKQIEDALIAVQETDRYYGECNTRFHLKPLTPENDTRTGSKLRKIDVNVESPYQEAWSSLGNIVDVVSLQGVYRKHEILLAVLQKQIFTIEWMKEKLEKAITKMCFSQRLMINSIYASNLWLVIPYMKK